MPAIVLFGRRWNVASDDFVIPSVLDIFVKIIWSIVIVISFIKYQANYECIQESVILFGFSGLAQLSIITDGALLQSSMKGSILNEQEKRRKVPLFIYIRAMIEIVNIALNIVATYWLFKNDSSCIKLSSLSSCIVTFNWVFFSFYLVLVTYVYDPLGRSSTQFLEYETNRNTDLKLFSSSIPIHRSKYSKAWERRCRFCCCSIFKCNSFRSDEVKDAFVEIGKIFAAEFDQPLVHSDAVAGLILLARKRKIFKRKYHLGKSLKHKQTASKKPNQFKSPCKELTIQNAYESENWRSLANLSHFVQYAISPFGWIIVLLDQPKSLGNLCLPYSCLPFKKYPFKVEGDNCCFTNTTSLKQIIGAEYKDIVHVSFKNKIFQTPYFLALDHKTKSIVLGIRGTLSLNDVLIDMSGWPAHIPGFPENFMAHHGILTASMKLKKKLETLQLIKNLAKKYPEYQLVITGHSLGAGTAAILSILIKAEYPNLRCYAYAPPGGLLSEAAAEFCNDFVTSVAYGDDVITRLGFLQFERLKINLMEALNECTEPKYHLLVRSLSCWNTISLDKDFSLYNIRKYNEFNEEKEHKIIEIDTNDLSTDEEKPLSPQAHVKTKFKDFPGMYPPGRILYIKRIPKNYRKVFNDKYVCEWTSRTTFDEIIVSKRMLLDHWPVTMPHALHYLARKENDPVKIAQPISK